MSNSIVEASVAHDPARKEGLQEAQQKQAAESTQVLPPSFSAIAAESAKRRWYRTLIEPSYDIPFDDSPPPDSGLRAWSQVFAGHLVLISTWGYINCFGWFQAHYVAEFRRPASDISWIVSIEIFILSLLSAPVGRCFDAGYYRHLLVAGFIFQIVGIMCTSVAKAYWQAFLAQGLCGGLAAAFLWTPHVSLVSTWFLKRRSFALALMLCGTSVGGVVWPVIAQQLGPVIGFAWTVRVMGFMILAFFAVVLSMTRTRIPPRKGGAFLEPAAFKESAYSLFVVGTFLILWAVYFAYFYVRCPVICFGQANGLEDQSVRHQRCSCGRKDLAFDLIPHERCLRGWSYCTRAHC